MTASAAAAPAFADPRLEDRFKAIEARTGGRLGMHAVSVGSGRAVGWRADERFLMCSTFKMLAVAAVLDRVDLGKERLDRWINYGAGDLQPYAPVAKANLDKGGMTLGAVCAAAVELSDNTCANLILKTLGGPQRVTAYIRSLGDNITRLDRTEPTLNIPATDGEPLDTTTPASMTDLWWAILNVRGHGAVDGGRLTDTSRARLAAWLEACSTGPNRLKAATPIGWRMGHKTGSGTTTAGDIAFFVPPDGLAILIAVYIEAAGAGDGKHDEAFAEAGRLALNALAGAPAHG